jgi:pseudouridine-5'-phosphate glycosidase
MAIVPARKRESRAQCSYVGMQLQKSAGSVLASNKLARSAPKRVAVRVNGGLGGAVTGTEVSASTSLEEMSGDSACAGIQTVQDRARPRTA